LAKTRTFSIMFQTVLAVLAIILTQGASSAGERIGVVRDIKGEASRTVATSTERLIIGSEVFLNDVIATDAGGYVILTLSNAKELTIGPETKMTVDTFVVDQGRDLEAVTGTMGFEAEGQDATGSETIRTVFGMIGVRG